MIINLSVFIRHQSMGKGSFWVIDGVKVKKKHPFVFDIVPHQQPPEKDLQHQPIHMHTTTNDQITNKTFFADNIEELHNPRIDYATFRNSASSLRDFYLFGPPPIIAQASTSEYYYMNEEQYQGMAQVKRSLFANEFVAFFYRETGQRAVFERQES